MVLSDKELLEDLFDAYYDARKNKRNTVNQLQFEINLEHNIMELYTQISQRRYVTGKSICFVVMKPVRREVFAADFRDRVVHHLVFGYMLAMCERSFIEDSYSCRKNKGTLFGIQRLEKNMRRCSGNYKRESYILKLDLRGYFMSMDKEVLKVKIRKMLDKFYNRTVSPNDDLYFSMVRKYESLKKERGDGGKVTFGEIVDFDLLWYLIEIVIDSDCTQNFVFKSKPWEREGLPKSKSLFFSRKGCGLTIGNLTSQLFSNIYLNDFDHFMKRDMKLKHYGRYVDDFYVVHQDREYLVSLIEVVRKRLWDEFRQVLHPNKIYIQPCVRGVDFLGARVKPFSRLVSKRTKVNFRQAMVEIDKECKGEMSFRKAFLVRSRINSYAGYTKHYKAFGLRRHLMTKGSFFEYMYLSRFCEKSIIKRKCLESWYDELIKEVFRLNAPEDDGTVNDDSSPAWFVNEAGGSVAVRRC
ncbi:MAG: RNA-directed DNA polymerase [Rikenellaceae bacterium]|nr:RNA-directed DNA polymerase [Rikenellaceae bacterium]